MRSDAYPLWSVSDEQRRIKVKEFSPKGMSIFGPFLRLSSFTCIQHCFLVAPCTDLKSGHSIVKIFMLHNTAIPGVCKPSVVKAQAKSSKPFGRLHSGQLLRCFVGYNATALRAPGALNLPQTIASKIAVIYVTEHEDL